MANPNGENRSGGMGGSLLFVLASATLIAGLYFGGPRRSPHRLLGQKAPPFAYQLSDGRHASLEGELGKVLLVNFWAAWCAPCVEEMASLRDLEIKLDKKPFVLLAFNIDEERPPVLSPHKLDSFPQNLIYTFDREFLGPFQITSIPFSVLIDKEGIVREFYWGPRRWSDSDMLQKLSLYF